MGTACPSEDLLMEMVDGTLEELPTLLVIEHLRGCPACQMRVGQHVAVARWVEARARLEMDKERRTAAAVAGRVAVEEAVRRALEQRETLERREKGTRTEGRSPLVGGTALAGMRRLAARALRGRLARRAMGGSWALMSGTVRAAAKAGGWVVRIRRLPSGRARVPGCGASSGVLPVGWASGGEEERASGRRRDARAFHPGAGRRGRGGGRALPRGSGRGRRAERQEVDPPVGGDGARGYPPQAPRTPAQEGTHERHEACRRPGRSTAKALRRSRRWFERYGGHAGEGPSVAGWLELAAQWLPEVPHFVRRLSRAVEVRALEIRRLAVSDPAQAGWALGAAGAARGLGIPVRVGTVDVMAAVEPGEEVTGQDFEVEWQGSFRIWPGRLLGAGVALLASQPARRYARRALRAWWSRVWARRRLDEASRARRTARVGGEV
ncbi:MAG: zf-HC2 domain-containing protein [Limnochordaceae bacterium]|nr:zf-HC2 domain-containing protein [Limnochordaceae bacterium]